MDTTNEVKQDNTQKQEEEKRSVSSAAPSGHVKETGKGGTSKSVNILLRCGALVSNVAVIYILAKNFWAHHSDYGDVFQASSNYTFTSYVAVALVILLYELLTFFMIMSDSKRGVGGTHKDIGRGLSSFIITFAGSGLSHIFYDKIPSYPALVGVKGALYVYGSVYLILLVLCAVGAVSCLARKYVFR